MSNNSHVSHNTMQYIQNLLMRISIPYIIIVSLIGIAGNVLTLIMLSKRSLTKNFNNCTLIALALADLLFNLALVSRCINDIYGSSSDNFCQILSFLSHLAELLSACFTAHFTIQRFIAVRFPLSVFVEKNIHFLHYIIVTLFILFGISYCFGLIKHNVYESCQEELQLNWFISDALLSFVIPFIIIAILNLLIIFHLRKTSRNNQQLAFSKRTKKDVLQLNPRNKNSISYESSSQSRMSENMTGANIKTSMYRFSTNEETNHRLLSVDVPPHRIASIRSTTRSHAQSHRVTRMLILVSTCFLLLNAPSHICTISLKVYTVKKSELFFDSYKPSFDNSTEITTSTIIENLISTTATTTYRENSSKINIKLFQLFYIIMIISQHISYLSYSINFFLYSFCGMKFRQELMKFLSRCGKYHGQIQTSHLVSGQDLL